MQSGEILGLIGPNGAGKSTVFDLMTMLLDEPAAGLRHLEKTALADLIRSLRTSGISILLVEHDMEFIMGLVDRVVVMNFGEKLAHGSPREIGSNPAVLEAYLGSVA
jgi:branched-chain amino acid transport system permease protein